MTLETVTFSMLQMTQTEEFYVVIVKQEFVRTLELMNVMKGSMMLMLASVIVEMS